VLVTGSTTGLGLAAGTELVESGHDVVLHARNRRRAEDMPLKSAVVIGDLAEPHEVTELAEQINQLGPFDAVIHNAGVGFTRRRDPNSRGQPSVTAVNVYAPYLLTALIQRPQRLIYLSSGMHAGGHADLNDLNWTSRRWSGTQAYSDSKLLVTTLALAVARRWPDVRSNVVDPGWVPTRNGRSVSE
jgi:NAD(P)-dependent dehydrogenase (short-subunit alcohol dehydrogenase family)